MKHRDGLGSKNWTKYPLANTKGGFHKQFDEDVGILFEFPKKQYMTTVQSRKTGKKHDKNQFQECQ